MPKVRIIASFLVIIFGPYTGSTFAQAQQDQIAISGSPLFWNIDKVLDLYVGHVTRYYNLNDAQEIYTRKLLTSKVKRFLKDYEKDVRSLAGEMLDYQFKRELPPP